HRVSVSLVRSCREGQKLNRFKSMFADQDWQIGMGLSLLIFQAVYKSVGRFDHMPEILHSQAQRRTVITSAR
ncbi:MAG TPA: hypothetical protein DIC58_05865, partial [Gammaproteobacteria bacterium]|nr:hypothetical protein [Gammaproteobacteria bacterium]